MDAPARGRPPLPRTGSQLNVLSSGRTSEFRPAESAVSAPAGLLARLREKRPRVHCVTNTVAQSFTANVLLALGAVPSMTVDPLEVGAFAASADALLVNLGTLDTARRAAIGEALAAARAHDRPWVLDPVFAERSPDRADLARSLAAIPPALVRLNPAELEALAGRADEAAAGDFARRLGTTVALTGVVDLVTDGIRRLRIENGHPLMGVVTAAGCAASACVAAFLAVEPDPVAASAGALLAFGIAAEIAGADAAGPGTFAAAFLDALYTLDDAVIAQRARLA